MLAEHPAKTAPKSGYVAVVYFHGMGSQRRYEELSRLIDALDGFANGPDRLADGLELVDIRAQLEHPRDEESEDVMAYVNLTRKAKHADGTWSRADFRFYEAYWAHVTAGGVPVGEVLSWLLAQVLTPIRALRTPWRLRARLRRAALLEVWPRLSATDPAEKKNDLKRLLAAYDEFEGWEARRCSPRGTAREFFAFLQNRWPDNPHQTRRLVVLAQAWHRFYLIVEWRNLLFLITAALTLGLVGLGLTAIAAGLLHGMAGVLPEALLNRLGTDTLAPNPANLTVAVGILLAALGGKRFLSEYLGDVQFWTTYQETAIKSQKRREILDTCAQALKHVLLDPACQRVVVISHSLGTTVAYDTILELARRNRVTDPPPPGHEPLPLDKIEHSLSLASPIDKVHYFFESHAGRYHRYNRVVEEVRGDLGVPPFSQNGRPLLHWINFWDQADIIGGALQTPANRAHPSVAIENVEVGSFLFPDPSAAHSAYFQHREVIKTIHDVVFDNAYSFRQPPLHPDTGKPDFAAARLAPGTGQRERSTLPCQILMLALPWLCLLYLLLGALGATGLRVAVGSVAALVAGALGIVWLCSTHHGHLHRSPPAHK